MMDNADDGSWLMDRLAGGHDEDRRHVVLRRKEGQHRNALPRRAPEVPQRRESYFICAMISPLILLLRTYLFIPLGLERGKWHCTKKWRVEQRPLRDWRMIQIVSDLQCRVVRHGRNMILTVLLLLGAYTVGSTKTIIVLVAIL